MGVLFSLALMGLVTWWLVHEIRKMAAEASSKRAHPSQGDRAVTTGGLALLERFKPKPTPEPTETDRLVAGAPKPKDPFGRMSDRRFRELAKEVALEGPAYWPEVPSVDRYCNCGTERATIRGFIYCPSCDGPLSDNRLEMA